jgi:DNA-binding beta-propeller fold protein YncE
VSLKKCEEVVMNMAILAHKRQHRIYVCALAIIQLLLVALSSMPMSRLSASAYDAVSTTNLTRVGGSGHNLHSQLADRKNELLYVLDSNMMRASSQILLIDPQSGNILRSFRANMAPDISVSNDGSRLYIASRLEGTSNGVLDVVDTATGRLIVSVDNPDHWTSTLHIYGSRMALSHDGKWLYVFKHRQEDDAYYIDMFDTVNNRFLPGKVLLEGCVTGILTPNPDNLQLTVTCGGTKDIRHLDLNGDGSLASKVKISKPRKAILPNDRPPSKSDIDSYPVATLAPVNNIKTAAIMSNGDVLSIDKSKSKQERLAQTVSF